MRISIAALDFGGHCQLGVGESFASSAADKVLDASALAAWASGHLGMQTWFGIAWELQLSF